MTDEPMIEKLERLEREECACVDDECDVLHDPDCPCNLTDHFGEIRSLLSELRAAREELEGAIEWAVAIGYPYDFTTTIHFPESLRDRLAEAWWKANGGKGDELEAYRVGCADEGGWPIPAALASPDTEEGT